MVVSQAEANAGLSFRNIPRVAVLTPENVGVADVLASATLLLSQAALDALTARANSARADAAASDADEVSQSAQATTVAAPVAAADDATPDDDEVAQAAMAAAPAVSEDDDGEEDA